MCGRYRFDDGCDDIELEGILEAVNRRGLSEPVKTSGEIFPSDVVPVVASSRRLAPSAFPMAWGYTLPDGKRLINARSETAERRPLFADGMRQRRCAVPATRYFEWQRASREKTKYAIRPAGDALFYMAGIYRMESGKPVFAILTREPAEGIAFIHDRMPVILPRALVKDWIDPRQPAGDILKQAVLDVFPTRAQENEQMRLNL